MRYNDDLRETMKLERARLAAKLRATRAILNMSQSEFAARVDLTQKSVHRLEQAQVEAKRSTLRMVEIFWRAAGIAFTDLQDGGFTISATGAAYCDESDTHSIAPAIDRFSAFPTRIPS